MPRSLNLEFCCAARTWSFVNTVDNAVKRQLQGKDQFAVATGQGLEWAGQNRRTLALGAGAILALIAVVVAVIAIVQHRTASATTAFGTAMQTYQTPLVTAGQPVPPGVKTFPGATERASAANARFLAVAQQYGGTEPGKLARYFAGLTYMEAGKNGPAEETLKRVASSWNGDVAALAKLALAQLYQQTGRDDQATSLYNELSNGHAATVPPGLAQIQLAEMYQAQGKSDQARKIYAQLKDKDKDAKGTPGPVGALAATKLNPEAAQQ